ncbi:MAG: hypothetical protein LUQ14_04040 [Methanomassiliicoccales archaeon]|nr:hypothetical protein [Methanomassiliicoccales archaeon]
MMRRGISRTQIEAAAWRVFLISLSFAVAITLFTLVFFGFQTGLYVVLPAVLLSLMLAFVLHNAPAGFVDLEERMMIRESPAVVGAMTMSMQLQPSIERGLSFATEHNEGVLSDRLREVMWRPMTRSGRSLSSSLLEFVGSLSEANESLRQSVYLIMSSNRERTREGMNRLLDKANAIVLSGIRESVDKYVASLSMPTMILFALGILLPVMLFSLLPLLSISTTFSMQDPSVEDPTMPGIPAPMLAFLLLVVFPVSSFLYARSTLARSPLQAHRRLQFRFVRQAIALSAFWIIATLIILHANLGEALPYLLLLTVTIPLSILLFVRFRKEQVTRRRRSEGEKDFVAAIYQIGNRMASGSSLEAALEDTAKSRAGSTFADLVNTVEYRSKMSNRSVQGALADELGSTETSPLLGGAMKIIAECSEKNPAGAGHVALNLAQYLSDLKSCESKIEERLRSLVDMMRSTSMIFAPIVLGITSSLVGIISDYGVSASDLLSQTILMVGLYIVELAAVVSYFTVFLSSEGGWDEVGYEFGRRVPLALAVFISTSVLCQFGLTRLL